MPPACSAMAPTTASAPTISERGRGGSCVAIGAASGLRGNKGRGAGARPLGDPFEGPQRHFGKPAGPKPFEDVHHLAVGDGLVGAQEDALLLAARRGGL